MNRWISAALVATPLLSCSATVPPINVLSSAEQALTAADQVILVYAKLPPCGGVDPVCSSPPLVATLKADSLKAFNAIEAARPIVLANPSGGTAEAEIMTLVDAAIAALTADLATIPASTKAAIHT